MEPGSAAVRGSGQGQSRWWRRLGRRSLLAGGAAAVMVAAGAGIGLASIPSSTGVFHGCYVKTTGALRLIDPSAHQRCKRGQLAVSWNQAGQRGPKGARGAKGAKGDPGPAGPPGLTFTTRTGQDSPDLSTAGTYFIVVKAVLENDSQNPLTGTCGIGDPSSPNVAAFSQPFVIPRGATAIESFSGMIIVTQGPGLPAQAQINCTVDDAAGTVVTQPGDPVWWVAKLPMS
jgi:hypothetical protein